MRVFLALEPSDEVEHQLGRAIRLLAERLPLETIRWLSPESVHLTLKFLGETSPADLDQVLTRAQAEAAASRTMDLTVGGFGVFPELERPRVLWVGVRESSGALMALKSSLEQAMEPLGFEPERREFTPHLTIGRVEKDIERGLQQELVSELQQVNLGTLADWKAKELTLFKSELKPAGAEYSALERWQLGVPS